MFQSFLLFKVNVWTPSSLTMSFVQKLVGEGRDSRERGKEKKEKKREVWWEKD